MRRDGLVELVAQRVDLAITRDRIVDPRLVDLARHPHDSSPGVLPTLRYGTEPYRVDGLPRTPVSVPCGKLSPFPQAEHHGFHRDPGFDILINGIPACQHGLQPAQDTIGSPALGGRCGEFG